jgi:hypothetical protein
MASFPSISVDQFARLVGTPNCPVLVEVRKAAALADDPFLVPGSQRREAETVATWATEETHNWPAPGGKATK